MVDAKQKLTLSVDSETIDQAKALGLNISELTERVLRSFTTQEPENTAEDALQNQRTMLFGEMVPMLKRFGAEVHVGVVDDPNGTPGDDYLDVVLPGSGKPVVLAFDGEGELYHAEPSEFGGRIYFDPPSAIVTHFMEAIEASKAKRKGEVASYLLAREIVKAISQVESGVALTQPPSVSAAAVSSGEKTSTRIDAMMWGLGEHETLMSRRNEGWFVAPDNQRTRAARSILDDAFEQAMRKVGGGWKSRVGQYVGVPVVIVEGGRSPATRVDVYNASGNHQYIRDKRLTAAEWEALASVWRNGGPAWTGEEVRPLKGSPRATKGRRSNA